MLESLHIPSVGLAVDYAIVGDPSLHIPSVRLAVDDASLESLVIPIPRAPLDSLLGNQESGGAKILKTPLYRFLFGRKPTVSPPEVVTYVLILHSLQIPIV